MVACFNHMQNKASRNCWQLRVVMGKRKIGKYVEKYTLPSVHIMWRRGLSKMNVGLCRKGMAAVGHQDIFASTWREGSQPYRTALGGIMSPRDLPLL